MIRTQVTPSLEITGAYQDARGVYHIPIMVKAELALAGMIRINRDDASGDSFYVATGNGGTRTWGLARNMVRGTDGVDYVKLDLRAAFARLAEGGDWKSPIDVELCGEFLPDGEASPDWPVYREAAIYFTGGPVEVSGVIRDADGKPRWVRVTGKGYRHHMGE